MQAIPLTLTQVVVVSILFQICTVTANVCKRANESHLVDLHYYTPLKFTFLCFNVCMCIYQLVGCILPHSAPTTGYFMSLTIVSCIFAVFRWYRWLSLQQQPSFPWPFLIHFLIFSMWLLEPAAVSAIVRISFAVYAIFLDDNFVNKDSFLSS